MLDEGEELYGLLPRFLVSRECDGELTDYVRGLLASIHRGYRSTAEARSVLTVREIRVIELVEQGSSNKDIARAMDISTETVKSHLKNIFEKLGVQQRSQAVLMARSLGLMSSANE